MKETKGKEAIWGNTESNKRKRNNKTSENTDVVVWKKQSILFNLPYWEKLLIRHNLDVMHMEKNVCENIFGILLDIKGKSKDRKKLRDDLQKMGLRKSLWPEVKGQKIFLPHAPHTHSKKEK